MEVVQIQPQAEDVARPILQMVIHAHEAVSYIQLHALRYLPGTWQTPRLLLIVNSSLMGPEGEAWERQESTGYISEERMKVVVCRLFCFAFVFFLDK